MYICFQVFVCDLVRIENPKTGTEMGVSGLARLGLTLDKQVNLQCDEVLLAATVLPQLHQEKQAHLFFFYCSEASTQAHCRWLSCESEF